MKTNYPKIISIILSFIMIVLYWYCYETGRVDRDVATYSIILMALTIVFWLNQPTKISRD